MERYDEDAKAKAVIEKIINSLREQGFEGEIIVQKIAPDEDSCDCNCEDCTCKEDSRSVEDILGEILGKAGVSLIPEDDEEDISDAEYIEMLENELEAYEKLIAELRMVLSLGNPNAMAGFDIVFNKLRAKYLSLAHDED